jgi:6-pyruvoyltetrahydropterin/6-carboxytetrahydropterin synthase
MYRIIKTLSVSSSHKLPNHDGKCRNLHGHNWKITVTCEAKELNEDGMIVDFGRIKSICNELDHTDINMVFKSRMVGKPPTAEVIAEYLCNRIPHCIKVEIEETEGNKAIFEKG